MLPPGQPFCRSLRGGDFGGICTDEDALLSPIPEKYPLFSGVQPLTFNAY